MVSTAAAAAAALNGGKTKGKRDALAAAAPAVRVEGRQ